MLFLDAVNEFVFECEVRRYSKKTIKGYKNNMLFLQRYLEREQHIFDLEDVKTIHLKRFIQYQQKKKCNTTYLNGLLKSFRAFFKYAINEEYIKENPVIKVSWIKESKSLILTFTNEEVKRMMNVYKGYDYLTIRNQAILAMLFEKVLLRYERVRKSYFEDKGNKPNNYFLSRTGKPLTVDATENIVRKAGEEAKISDSIRCSPHTCRHWFAQTQLKNGLDIYSVSRLMGHNNIKITQRYLDSIRDNDILIRAVVTSPLMNL